MAASAPKNLLGITTSVHCVGGRGRLCGESGLRRDLLPKYPNVDGVVGLNHLYGCGVAINAPAAVVPIRTIHNIALNPNFGGEVMVNWPRLRKTAAGTTAGKAPRMFPPSPLKAPVLVAFTGRAACRALNQWSTIFWRVAERHLTKLNQRQRETCPASELVVGMQCGGSDAFFWRHGKPGGGLCFRSAGTLRRDRHVLGGHRSARCHSSF
ncbi:D-galactarate dehydratase [Salmonella enterica subsp. enterica]|uniref:D-galactarate dehydratase n=1 Tax=Salmonella enterica I TaxID=59201 RepID=A0A447TV03_SALET|nr:D-galactarate dehydratase [Salmonella enterica subsp. enterica]